MQQALRYAFAHLRSNVAAHQMSLTGLQGPCTRRSFGNCVRPAPRRSIRACVRVTPPPAEYDFRSDCIGSLEHVQAHYPSLVDLVEEGQNIHGRSTHMRNVHDDTGAALHCAKPRSRKPMYL